MKTYTDADAAEANRLYLAEVPVDEIAETVGCSRRTVEHLLYPETPRRGLGWGHRLRGDAVERIVQLYKTWGLKDIADITGHSRNTVRRVLQRAGVPLRPGGRAIART